jgi:hypothetical protein
LLLTQSGRISVVDLVIHSCDSCLPLQEEKGFLVNLRMRRRSNRGKRNGARGALVSQQEQEDDGRGMIVY